MGSESGRIAFTITIDNQGKVVIDDTKKQIQGLEQTATGATGSMSEGFSSMWKSMAVGFTAANLVQKGFEMIKDVVKDSIIAYIEQEKVNTKLNSALRASGELVLITGKNIDTFASKMQFLTGVDDEQVKSLEGLARSYGMQKGLIDDAVKGTLGLVELYGGDYETVLKAVSKAYEGQWGAITKLIPELENVSDESDKLKLLQEKMGDGIQAATDRMQSQVGQVQQLASEWDNFKEDFGGIVVSFITGFANMNGALDARRYAQMEMMKQTAESDAQERLVSQERQNRISREMIIEERQAGAEATWAKENDEYIKNGFRTKAQIEIDKKKIDDAELARLGKITESFQQRYDKEQATAKLEEAYVAFVNAKYIPSAEKILALYDSMPKGQSDWNDQIEFGVPLLGAFEKETEDVTAKEDDATTATEKWYKDAQDLAAGLQALANVFDDLIPGLGDVVSGVMGAYEATTKFAAAQEAGTATLGGFLGMAGAVVGGMVALSKAVDAYVQGQERDFIISMNEGIKVTEEQAEKIRLLANEMAILDFDMNDSKTWSADWDAYAAATSKALGDVINATDLTADNFDEYANRVHGILSDLDRGMMTGVETATTMGAAFEALMKQAKDLGTEGSASLMLMFDDVKARGLQVKEINDYIAAQNVAGLEGYKKMKAATLENADALAAFGGMNIQVFDDMIAYEKKVAENQGLVDGINGATAAMTGLSNAQKLTENQFNDFALAGYIAYEKLMAGGMTNTEALKTMAPYLQRLLFLHEQYGYTIDDATQKLINEGIASGTVFENQKTESQQMIDQLTRIADALCGKLPAALVTFTQSATGAFGNVINAAGQMSAALDGAARARTVEITTKNIGGYIAAAEGGNWVVPGGSYQKFVTGETEPEFVSITPMSKMGSGSWMSPQIGSDSKQTVIVEDHSVITFNIDPKSGIDQNELTAAMAIVIKDNRQMIADTMAAAVKRKL